MTIQFFDTDRPAIAGLAIRIADPAKDLETMVEISNAAAVADGGDHRTTVEQQRANILHPFGFDPARHLFVITVEGVIVAWLRLNLRDTVVGERVFGVYIMVSPAWRGRGIEAWLLRGAQRLTQVWDRESPHATGATATLLDAFCLKSNTARREALEAHGYTACRWIFLMTRPLDGNYPDFRLPEDLVVRPVTRSQFRQCFDFDTEAFRDHWGFAPPTEDDYLRRANDPDIFPALFKVAFDREGRIAGQVMNFIDESENLACGRTRGYTEDISTRSDQRRRGVARALIVESLKMFQALGMTEAALHVDTENATGALSVYLDCGYTEHSTTVVYRRPLYDTPKESTQ